MAEDSVPNDSILNTTKKVLGIGSDYDAFDTDIIMHINTVFFTLQQLGVGPSDGFMITDETTSWGSYLGSDKNLNAVKTYTCLRVRLLFDPPATSFAIEAITKQIEELEWRLKVEAENFSIINTPVGDLVDEFGDPKEFQLGEILVDPTSGDIWRNY